MENITIIETERFLQLEKGLNTIAANLEYIKCNTQFSTKPIYTNSELIELMDVDPKTLKK